MHHGQLILYHAFLIHIQQYQFHCCRVIETYFQLKVISSCLVEGFGEIRRIVERITCTGGVTVSPIPGNVIGMEHELYTVHCNSYIQDENKKQ